MADDAAKNADKRAVWLKKKVDVCFGKAGDKKFEKAFYAEENLVKVQPARHIRCCLRVHQRLSLAAHRSRSSTSSSTKRTTSCWR